MYSFIWFLRTYKVIGMYPHWTDKKTGVGELNGLPKVTQLERSRNGVQMGPPLPRGLFPACHSSPGALFARCPWTCSHAHPTPPPPIPSRHCAELHPPSATSASAGEDHSVWRVWEMPGALIPATNQCLILFFTCTQIPPCKLMKLSPEGSLLDCGLFPNTNLTANRTFSIFFSSSQQSR